MADFPVYLLTPGAYDPSRAGWLLPLLEAGASRLHIRYGDIPQNELISLLAPLCARGYAPRLVLHHHHDLREELPGIHLHLTSRARQAIQCLPDGVVSTSAHSLDEIRALPPGGYDYVFLSPIFESISKPGYSPVIPRPALRDFLRSSDQAVVALGGITAGHLDEVRALGFSAAATLGFVWGAGCLNQAVARLQSLLRT